MTRPQPLPAARGLRRDERRSRTTWAAFLLGVPLAFAVLAAFSDAGIPIPESVAVMGCDDIPLAQFSTPPLTTIRFDKGQQLDLLIENILAASRGEPLQEVPLPPLSVIVRASA